MAAVNSVVFCLDIAAPVQVFIRNFLPGKDPSVHAGQFRFISKLLNAIARQSIHFDHSGVRSGLIRIVSNVTRIYRELRVGWEIVVMQKDAAGLKHWK